MDIQRLYELYLSGEKIVIMGKAYDGLEAIEKYKKFSEKPSFIIMDYRMPIKDGLEVTEEILKMDRNAKIIFVSADESIKDIAITIGAKMFIKKPFIFKDFMNEVTNLLNG